MASTKQTKDDLFIAAEALATAEVPAGLVTQPIVISEINMPSEQSIMQSQLMSTAKQAGMTTSGNERLAEFSPQTVEQLRGFQAAIDTADDVSTRPTSVIVGRSVVQLSSGVRDIPHKLYVKRHAQLGELYVRERADAILKAVFGPELTPHVFEAAARRGFRSEPLVWASQEIDWHLVTDVPHDYVAKTEEDKFETERDESPSSPIVQCLQACFDSMTVKNIIRLAKFSKVSSICVVRTIMEDVCKKMGTNPPREVA